MDINNIDSMHLNV